MLEPWLKELGVGLRSLLRAPMFTAVVVLTLAIGIGGTVALFSGVNTAYFRALPFPEAECLAAIWQTRPSNTRVRASMLNFLDWKSQNHSFEHLAAFANGRVNISSGDQPERMPTAFVTQDFFAVLGVHPERGRTFSSEETFKSSPRRVIISRTLAEKVFGGDPDPTGKTLQIEELPFQVIGVMPRGFEFPDKERLWLPLPTDDGTGRSAHNYQVVGRLKRGVQLNTATADMETVSARLVQAYPEENKGEGIAVIPLRQDLLGRSGSILLLLLGAAVLVLLIGSTNVISLLLARTLARDGETTLRLVLGASGSALVRPFLIESLLLALLGGIVGLLLAIVASHAISTLIPDQVLSQGEVGIDALALLFTFGLSLAVGLLCGLAPAFKARQTDLRSALVAGTRSTRGVGGLSVLVAIEVALACILLIGAGLLIRNVVHLEAVQPGFAPRGVALIDFSMGVMEGSRSADPAWRTLFYDRLLESATTLPEVRAVGAINQAPLSGRSYNGTLLLDPGDDRLVDPEEGFEAHYRLIGGQYFQALRIPLIQGRTFAPGDREGAPLVAIVNQRMKHMISPDGQVLGLRVKIPGMDGIEEWASIVGVVGDVRHRGLSRDPVPEIYFPYAQRPQGTSEMTIVVQGTGDPMSLARRIRDEAQTFAPVPAELKTMPEAVDRQLTPLRFRARLLTLFAIVALALATIGIFGVVSYTMQRRNREIGIRMALGADRVSVCLHMLRRGMTPILIGIGAGLVAAWALRRFLTSLVDGVPSQDSLTIFTVVLLLSTIAMIANYLPARRASQADPLRVLKAE